MYTIPDDALPRVFATISASPEYTSIGESTKDDPLAAYEIELPTTFKVPVVQGDLAEHEREIYAALGLDWVAVHDRYGGNDGWQYHLVNAWDQPQGVTTVDCTVSGLYLARPGCGELSAVDIFLVSTVGGTAGGA